jgi:hypothetical protein
MAGRSRGFLCTPLWYQQIFFRLDPELFSCATRIHRFWCLLSYRSQNSYPFKPVENEIASPMNRPMDYKNANIGAGLNNKILIHRYQHQISHLWDIYGFTIKMEKQ